MTVNIIPMLPELTLAIPAGAKQETVAEAETEAKLEADEAAMFDDAALAEGSGKAGME